jgi:hypothetical protein
MQVQGAILEVVLQSVQAVKRLINASAKALDVPRAIVESGGWY